MLDGIVQSDCSHTPANASGKVNFIYRMRLRMNWENDVCKIGRTNNLEKRRKDNSSHPGVPGEYDPLGISAFAVASVEEATRLESAVLTHCREAGLGLEGSRENFRCSVYDFRRITEIEADRLGVRYLNGDELAEFCNHPQITDECWKFRFLSGSALATFAAGLMEGSSLFDRSAPELREAFFVAMFHGLALTLAEKDLGIDFDHLLREGDSTTLRGYGAKRFLKNVGAGNDAAGRLLAEWSEEASRQ